MRERDYLYLKGTEELGEVIEVVRDYAGQEVILVVPVGMRALAHPVNLELLKRETDRLKKKIFFSTEDDSIRDLVKAAGFNVFLEEYEDPKVVQKMVTDIVAPRAKAKARRAAATDDEPVRRHRRFRLGWSWGWLRLVGYLLVIALIIGGVALAVSQFSSRATVTVTLAEEGRDFNEVVEIRPHLTDEAAAANVLLGDEIKITKTHTLFAPATGAGKEGGRAKGFITVTNGAGQSLSLIQGTRFQSPTGKIYRSTGRVTITTGKTKVEVIAEEPGDQYNIAAKTAFTIPGLKGTSWESSLTATAEAGIDGGSSTAVKVVTVDDLAQGRAKFEQELKDLITKELTLRYPNYLLPEELGSANIEITDVSHKVGQPAERIVFAGRGELKTIGVQKERLIEYLKDRIAKAQLQQQANVRITELNIANLKTIDLDPKLNFLRVEASGTVKVKGDVDRAAIQAELVGQTLEQVQQVLKKNPNIENAEASIWPFWAKTLPSQSSKIEVRVR